MLRRRLALVPCLLASLACTDPGTDDSSSTSPSTSTDDGSDSSETGTSTGDGDGDGDSDEPYPWPDETLSDYIDPMIGTGGVGYTVGTMNPGPALPFGMIKPGPDTGIGPIQISFMNCTGYHYEQTHLWGFSHSRINGMGVPDYGAIAVTPTSGFDDAMTDAGGARSLYDHAEETATAGYYAVELLEHGVLAELTTTMRAVHYRYTWDQPSADASLVFNLGYNPAQAASIASEVEIDAAGGMIRGMMTVYGSYSDRFGGVPTYFAARVSQPIAGHGTWDDMDALAPDSAAASGAEIGAWLRFDLSSAAEPVVELELAISYVSIEAAEQNLAELDGMDFDQTRAAAAQAWDHELARVRVLGGSEEQRRLFYSALYRAFLTPTTFSDASGAYRGFDKQVHQADDFTYYTDFSLWDTYRTTHPLFNLLQRDRHADMMHSLAMMAAQGGDLPKWPLGIGYTGGMVGTSADIVLADAYLKDITDFDVDTAYQAARLHATEPRPNAGRSGITGFRERGWVASDEASSSVSRAVEFSHADYALSRWAAALGEDQDAALFEASSHNWQNHWSPELEFLIGRRADGSFDTQDFDPDVWLGIYAEGTAHHYLWAVPHDVAALAELLGGVDAARARLSDYYETSLAFMTSDYDPIDPVPYHWQSNEPSLHDPWLFIELGDPAAAARWIDWVRERWYGPGPNGLPGNDDAGTMSAWYVFASIGLYPLPGSDGWWVTAPTFERIELDLSDADHPDRKLTIIAEGAGPGAIYLVDASFDNVALERPWLTWQQLREAGGTLRLTVSSNADNAWMPG